VFGSATWHGEARGFLAANSSAAAGPSSCIRAPSGVNAFELIHVLVAGPSLFWKFSGNHNSEECMSHLFNLVAQYGPLNPERDESGNLVDPSQLILGDWGEYDWFKGIALILLLMFFCCPIFGRYSIIGYLNIFLFPFRLNKMLDNMDDFYKRK
jgi:hypothetical protein